MQDTRGTTRCGGVLLTGGSSRRLGTDKAMLRAGHETLAARAARVLAEVCAPVVEVGPGRSGLPRALEEVPGDGPLAALVAGSEAVGGGPVLLLAVDLPRVTPELLRLLATWPGPPGGAVVPVSGGVPQRVCARYGPDALAAARTLLRRGERSLRALDDLTPVVRVAEVVWRRVAAADALVDVDTAADVERLGLEPPG